MFKVARCSILLLWLAVPAISQPPAPSDTPGGPATPSGSLVQPPRLGAQPVGGLEITARILLEDNSPLNRDPLIVLLFRGRYGCELRDVFLDGVVKLTTATGECEIQVMLPGYHTVSGYVNDGRLIVLRPLGPNEGNSISVTTLSAPAAAQKLYNAGEASMQKEKWSDAEAHFREAITVR